MDEHGVWNSELLSQTFWPMDVKEILKIRASPRQREDFIAWQPERTGIFTICSAYRLAMSTHKDQFGNGASSSGPDGSRRLWNLVWQAKVPQKINIIAWKVSSGALATKKNKSIHHLQMSAMWYT